MLDMELHRQDSGMSRWGLRGNIKYLKVPMPKYPDSINSKSEFRNPKKNLTVQFSQFIKIFRCRGLGFRILPLGFVLLILQTNCAYFNTFYNAQNYYAQGKKLVQSDTLINDSEFFDKAIEKATAVIVKYPSSKYIGDALFIMGSSYYYKGDYVRAVEKLDLLIQNYPDSKFYDDALYFQGLAHYKSNRLNKAIISFSELKNYRRYRKLAGIMLCYAYYKDKNFASLNNTAQSLLKERLSKKERITILNILGEAQYDLKLYEEALRTYQEMLKMIRLSEETKRIKLKIAKIYFETNRYEECKYFLSGEDEPDFKLILAGINLKTNCVPEAKKIYLELLDNKSSEYVSRAYYELGQLGEYEDSLELAIAYYDSAAKLSGGDYPLMARKRGDILRRINNLVQDTIDLARARFHLAELYYTEIKDINKALTFYEQVYRDFPGSEWAPKALYARFWITKNLLKEDSLSLLLAHELFKKYPNTEYASSAKKILGLENSIDETYR